MTEKVKHIVDSLNVARPYVWKLHLSAEDFQTLEAYIIAHREAMMRNLTQKDALALIIYLAEWYKRCYQGSEAGQTNAADMFDAKRLWGASGINTERYVYKTEIGTSLWRYSIYVLGGLAVRHELSKNDKNRFLKALCRMFHGEEYTLENLDDANRAMAFRQSIMQQHSLYEYLREILDGAYEAADTDGTALLIEAIRTVNEEILRRKFALEWIVINTPSAQTMTRRLKLWLKPEQVGEGLHQYLRYDRVAIWGIAQPEKLRNLYIGMRWRQGDNIVVPLDKRSPILVYSNTCNGFVYWGAEDRFGMCQHIPSVPFSHIDIIAYDGEGNEWVAQTEETQAWMQLWRSGETPDRWTSRKGLQRQTAVVFTEEWTADIAPDMQKCFKDKLTGLSEQWRWCYIQSDVTITNTLNESFTLYNRMGYDQVYTQLYKETICYREGGKIRAWEEDDEMGMTEEFYPVIFGREDVRVRHFKTKDAITNAEVESDEPCEVVEFKANGRYEAWTEANAPQSGLRQLRALDKGVEYKLTALYLKNRIARNLEENSITYADLDGNVQVYKDEIPCDHQPLLPTITLHVGQYELDVYRPTSVKEVYYDGKVHLYVKGGERFTLPYIYHNRVRIVDYGSHGYRTYDCHSLESPCKTFNKEENNGALYHLGNYTTWPVQELDVQAPEWLDISLSKKTEKPTNELSLLKANIYQEDSPQSFTLEDDYKKQKGDVIFQNSEVPDGQLSYYHTDPGRPDMFAAKRIKGIELRCFETAIDYLTYFSIFQPLRIMAQNDKTSEVLIAQIKEKYGEEIPTKFRDGLIRFADEFQLAIDQLGFTK